MSAERWVNEREPEPCKAEAIQRCGYCNCALTGDPQTYPVRCTCGATNYIEPRSFHELGGEEPEP